MGTGVLVSPFVKIPKGSDRVAGLRAAAAAALKALAESGRSTVLFEDAPVADELSDEPAPDQQPSAVEVAARSHDEETVAAGEASLNTEGDGHALQLKIEGSPKGRGTNPLAAFLGSYSDDESAGGDEVALESSSDTPKSKQPADMDDELSKFMQELESSGLLEDGQTHEEAHTLSGPTEVAASPAHTGDPPGGDTPPAAAEGAAAAKDDPAEQRTLGMLAAAPEWYKVLDTGSGREYFWNVVTNDVLWEPPEGVESSVLLPVESTTEPSMQAEAEGGNDESSVGRAGGDAAAALNEAPMPEVTKDDSTPSARAVEQPAGGQVCSSAPSSTMLAPGQEAQLSCEDVPEPLLTSCDVDAAATDEPSQAAGAAPAVQTRITLRQPQQDVQPVFNTLLLELQSVPQVVQQAQQLPAAARLLLQLQVLHEQWLVFAAQQHAAAAAAQHMEGVQPFSWLDYEHYVMQHLQQAAQQLQSTLHAVQVPDNAAGESAGGIVQDTVEQQQQCASEADQQQDAASPKPVQEPEEGEVCPSPPPSPSSGDADDMEVDMDLEVDPGPKEATQGADAASLQQQLSSVLAAQAIPAQRGRHGALAGGMYASTMHLPLWARPDYHYSFAGHDPVAVAGQRGFPVGYDYGLPAHPSYVSYGHVYSDAARQDAVALGNPPPLPADDPPPLPDDYPPQVAADANSDQAAAVACGDAPTVAAPVVAAPPAKRQKVVAAPAVRTAVAVAGAALTAPVGADSGLLAHSGAPDHTAGLLSTDGKDGHRTNYEQKVSSSGGAVNAVLPTSAAGPSSKASSKVRSGKMGALLNKWASVRQQQQQEEEQRQRQLEQEADPEFLEAKRVRELEQWSKQQMAAGSEDNPNFTPVSGDWRSRLGLAIDQKPEAAAAAGGAAETPEERAARKAARRAAKAAKKAAAASKATGDRSQWPTSMKVKPDVAALSVGLPPGWVAMYEHDEVTGLYNIYYGNPETKASMVCVSGVVV